MHFDDEEEKKIDKGPKFPIQMYISEGNHYFRLGKHDLAIEFFNKGLEKEPGNEKCLIGRSKCYMGLAKYVDAKKDAETVVKSNPKSCDAKMLIGEADYFLGDFEKAFLTFYRGYRSRTNHSGLRCSHQMCRKAIDNALKPDVPIVFDDEDIKDLFKLSEDLDVDQTFSPGQDQYSAHVDFINSLLQDENMASVHEDCIFLKDYLRDRQIFWGTQNPNTSKKDRTHASPEVKATDNFQENDSSVADDKASSDESYPNTLSKSTVDYKSSTIKNESPKDSSLMSDKQENDDEISSSPNINATIQNEKDKAEDDIVPDSNHKSILSDRLKNNTGSNLDIAEEKN